VGGALSPADALFTPYIWFLENHFPKRKAVFPAVKRLFRQHSGFSVHKHGFPARRWAFRRKMISPIEKRFFPAVNVLYRRYPALPTVKPLSRRRLALNAVIGNGPAPAAFTCRHMRSIDTPVQKPSALKRPKQKRKRSLTTSLPDPKTLTNNSMPQRRRPLLRFGQRPSAPG
jgi:hypothetical protein